MTTKTRSAPLPPGVVPLLTMPQLQAYYGVSDWTVLRWIDAGMPVEPMTSPRRAAAGEPPKKVHRRFDLSKVQAWHAAHAAELANAS
jgi:hypothetical protein